ncbi:phospho-N-acetylmuramoyl-pentapeptide-transferase [Proteiniclasticum sp. SCR006]|uniref:Phospho-N-acetylmuramoyl-pentapeptide-transferase n=1 Tax=Proteiniclasticum aestuarii TaxID=2817862 RepID=A0A939H790_9CLOT|nr:phospho-N-acetylmuramoyl-pentapeptide-transferase [Proteiniclasticum aestuarii]MBO1263764.1 phospho-N-acetylmuramoyl-pentapeptide-transferase [Proteiniclasticum aestuarii]
MEFALISMVLSIATAVIIGPYIISKLRSFKFGQNVRLDGPESHLTKQGIPSMGGFIFLSVLTVMGSILSGFNAEILFMILVTLSFGLIGFLDDYLKVKKKSSDGLSAKHKMLYLLIFGLLAGSVLHFGLNYSSIVIPFINQEISLGIFYLLFVVIFFAAVTNAVNLTDGIDGLSSSVTIVVLLFFVLVSLAAEDKEVLFFSLTLIGSLMGFLYFNRFPAKVFMGDTGSLALGGAVGILSLLTKTELLLILVGIIYVIETLSVIIQVGYFKKTGKRVFKMAPIHHHFEALGWKETKIVRVFSLVTLIMVVGTYLLM